MLTIQIICGTMDLQIPFLLVSFALAPMALGQPLPPSYPIEFNLSTETYNDLYLKLRKLLSRTSHPPYVPTDIYGRYVLAKPRDKFYGTPAHWIMVDVKTGQTETTLAIAHDDLYLLGFKNSAGDWYIVQGFAGLPNNITLPLRQNYGDLIGGGHANLYTVPLGKQPAVEAVRWIAGYPATTTEAQLKQALVRFVVMFCEAVRFKDIRGQFSEQWEQVSFITQALTAPHRVED